MASRNLLYGSSVAIIKVLDSVAIAMDQKMPANDHLCNYCQSFFDKILIPGNLGRWIKEDGKIERWSANHRETRHEMQWQAHWPTFCKFMKSAYHGCHLCALFLLQVSGKERSKFQAFESKNPTKALKMGIQDARHRKAGRYDLLRSHGTLEGLRKERYETSSTPY